MDKFKDLFTESTTPKVTSENIFNVKKVCSNRVPIRAKRFDSVYDTTYIAKRILEGYHVFNVDVGANWETTIISPEDLAKHTELYNMVVTKKGGKFKSGRKTWHIYNGSDEISVSKAHNYVNEMFIEGDVVEKVVKAKHSASDLNTIKNGVVVNAMKVPLTVEYVEGWYAMDDTAGFCVQQQSGGMKILLRTSWDIAKGEPFVIFGQQHATKNSRFTFVNRYEYMQVPKHILMPPKAYTKSKIVDRAKGTFVAK